MGAGSWSVSTHKATQALRARTGSDGFDYSAKVRAKPMTEWKAHDTLDPKGVNRECRDSDEHPNSTPIAVLFDVTGSMHAIPRVMQKELAKLHGLVERGGYAVDPQVMFGAIGDADTDAVPLQVGQFESDNRMDADLGNLFLEGNGGGQRSESYELAAYFMAHHVYTDSWEKRGRKGYLFIIGDELNKRVLEARHIAEIIGDDAEENLSVESIYRELQERWEVFFILPNQTSYYNEPDIIAHWRKVLGERALRLEDPNAVCETIAVTIGLLEDAINLNEGLADLAAIGSTSGGAVGKALATVGAGRAVSTTSLPTDTAEDDLA